jgi:hypothetical protein
LTYPPILILVSITSLLQGLCHRRPSLALIQAATAQETCVQEEDAKKAEEAMKAAEEAGKDKDDKEEEVKDEL